MLALRFRPHSFAAQDADELADRYADALQAVGHALELDAARLPRTAVFLTDSLPSSEQRAEAEGRPPSGLVIWAVHSPETPCAAPELDLVPLLLTHRLGAPPPAARFWDEGLAGYLAGRSGRCPYHADASTRCHQAVTDGLLPPVEELVGEARARVSTLTASSASAFATYLIDRFGMARYRRLLRAVRSHALGESFVLDLRRHLLDSLGRLPAAYFARTTGADASQRVLQDTAAPYLLGRLAGRLDIHRQLNVAYARENSLLGQTVTLIVHLIQVAVLLSGGYLVVVSDGQDLAPGGLAAFYVLLNQLFGPIGQAAGARQSLTDASASLERVSELLAEPTEQDPPDGVALAPLREEIRFDGVSFAYTPDGPSVLKRLSLTIAAGSTVAFVGPTGAGKSSLVQLLPRLYDPTRGTISWDGVDLRRARLASLRRQVALVPQDPFLLSATVYENIRFGLADVSDADVERSARLARAHDFIAALPHGYDTPVGERGVGLSGGQRQRLALARALLRNPSVLILDEATSALDASTQRALQEGLRAGGDGRTVIKIAHRLETVADADDIFVLDDGRLVEQGRHADLLAANGLYARLFEDQMGALADAARPSPRQVVRWLARLAPFAELPSTALEVLAASLERKERKAGETIYR